MESWRTDGHVKAFARRQRRMLVTTIVGYNRRVPGRERTPWHEIALALKDIGYNGNVCMEPFVRMGGKVGEDIKIWRELEPGITEAKMDADAKAALDFERIVFEGVR